MMTDVGTATHQEVNCEALIDAELPLENVYYKN